MIEGMAMENRNLGYKSYWVAYFDLLGFENRVKGEKAIWSILEGYRTALAEIRTNPGEIRNKWFSDTFLFYTPDDSRTSFRGMETACQSFFYRMMISQIPVRGCLAVGDFYEDASDDVLVGPALIEAYRLAEGQDWLGFVLSTDAVRRREQYGIRSDCYREYDVPFDHGKSTKRLEAFILSHRFPQCCSPDEWWRCLDEMEGDAPAYVTSEQRRGEQGQSGGAPIESEMELVLRKYRNSKKYLRSLYPQLVGFVQDEYGPILLNDPEVKRKIRGLSWRLK
jgi:hypothetical protein